MQVNGHFLKKKHDFIVFPKKIPFWVPANFTFVGRAEASSAPTTTWSSVNARDCRTRVRTHRRMLQKNRPGGRSSALALALAMALSL